MQGCAHEVFWALAHLGVVGIPGPKGDLWAKHLKGSHACQCVPSHLWGACSFVSSTIQEADSGFVMKDSVINVPIFLFTIHFSPKKEVAGSSGIA